MKLRYVGATPVSFTQAPIGEVFPGEEFEVPEDQAEALLAHALIELVPAKAGKTRSKDLPAAAEPAPAPVLDELAGKATSVEVAGPQGSASDGGTQ